MAASPIQAYLGTLDAIDLDGTVELFAPDGLLTTLFGERAQGSDQIRAVMERFLGGLRSTTHALESEWNPEPGLWIATVTARYELSDYSHRGPYERALIVRAGDAGITELRTYGQHELPLSESGRPYAEVHGAHHGWLPTL